MLGCNRPIEDDGGCECCVFSSFWECVLDDYDCSDGNNSLTDHVDLDWIEYSLDWNQSKRVTVGDRFKSWKEKRVEAKRLIKENRSRSSWKVI
jgi:hypothetical protein